MKTAIALIAPSRSAGRRGDAFAPLVVDAVETCWACGIALAADVAEDDGAAAEVTPWPAVAPAVAEVRTFVMKDPALSVGVESARLSGALVGVASAPGAVSVDMPALPASESIEDSCGGTTSAMSCPHSWLNLPAS